MNTDKLLPCPFCGSSEINSTSPPIVVDGVCWWVCPECIAISPLAKSVNDATEKWNTRANESEIAELTKQRDDAVASLDAQIKADSAQKEEAAKLAALSYDEACKQRDELKVKAETFDLISNYHLSVERVGTWFMVWQGENRPLVLIDRGWPKRPQEVSINPDLALAYELSLSVAVRKAVAALSTQEANKDG